MVAFLGIGEGNIENLQLFVFQVIGKPAEPFFTPCLNNRARQ